MATYQLGSGSYAPFGNGELPGIGRLIVPIQYSCWVQLLAAQAWSSSISVTQQLSGIAAGLMSVFIPKLGKPFGPHVMSFHAAHDDPSRGMLLQQLHHQRRIRLYVTCQACICFALCAVAVSPSSKDGQVGQDVWRQQAESKSGQANDIEDSCSANWSDLWKHAACGAGIVGAWYLLHMYRRHLHKHRRSAHRSGHDT